MFLDDMKNQIMIQIFLCSCTLYYKVYNVTEKIKTSLSFQRKLKCEINRVRYCYNKLVFAVLSPDTSHSVVNRPSTKAKSSIVEAGSRIVLKLPLVVVDSLFLL